MCVTPQPKGQSECDSLCAASIYTISTKDTKVLPYKALEFAVLWALLCPASELKVCSDTCWTAAVQSSASRHIPSEVNEIVSICAGKSGLICVLIGWSSC